LETNEFFESRDVIFHKGKFSYLDVNSAMVKTQGEGLDNVLGQSPNVGYAHSIDGESKTS